MLPTSELLMPIGVNVRTSSAFALRRIRPGGEKRGSGKERGNGKEDLVSFSLPRFVGGHKYLSFGKNLFDILLRARVRVCVCVCLKGCARVCALLCV